MSLPLGMQRYRYNLCHYWQTSNFSTSKEQIKIQPKMKQLDISISTKNLLWISHEFKIFSKTWFHRLPIETYFVIVDYIQTEKRQIFCKSFRFRKSNLQVYQREVKKIDFIFKTGKKMSSWMSYCTIRDRLRDHSKSKIELIVTKLSDRKV